MHYDNLIIDGTNIEFRSFFVSKKTKTINTAGEQTGCIYLFLNTFKDLVKNYNPTNVYVCWDKRLVHKSTNFRKDIMIDQYKAGRNRPDDISEMYEQEERLIEMLSALGAKNMFPNVLEADDVIAWLSNTLKGTNLIVSVDKDLLQLIDENTSVYNLKKVISIDSFESDIGIPLERYKIFKAIKGDTSDNIPGLPGYGDVRSKRLAYKWDSTIASQEFKDIIERNLELMDLDRGYLIQEGEEDSYKNQFSIEASPNIEAFKTLCERYEFAKYLNNFSEWSNLINRNNVVSVINTLKEI